MNPKRLKVTYSTTKYNWAEDAAWGECLLTLDTWGGFLAVGSPCDVSYKAGLADAGPTGPRSPLTPCKPQPPGSLAVAALSRGFVLRTEALRSSSRNFRNSRRSFKARVVLLSCSLYAVFVGRSEKCKATRRRGS